MKSVNLIDMTTVHTPRASSINGAALLGRPLADARRERLAYGVAVALQRR
jgi:hypothetical protein